MIKIHSEALAYCLNNNWDAAHRLVQDHSDALSCRIHGYLHRVEGDMGNAAYWYRRAGLSLPVSSLTEELSLLRKLADQDNP
jgi:hypothetical protein